MAENGGDRLGAAVQPDQGRGEQGDGGQQPGAGGDALRVQVMGEQQKIAEHDDHQRVAPAAHLQWFQGHEDDQQRDPRILAEQGAELPGNGCDAADDQQRQRPARRQRAPLLP
jgi:hypothetical protein